MEIDQILRLGEDGTIIFSIIENKPKNFEEIDEFIHENGEKYRRTRRSETVTLIGDSKPGLQIKYISTEDLINIIANEKENPNKKTLINKLFETRDLDPKKGKLLMSESLRISQNDLVITSEEWKLFEQNTGKKLTRDLAYPAKVTIPWLLKNVSISYWIAFAGLCISIFLAGVYVAESKAYKDVFSSKVEKLERSNANE